ncbi:MAG: dihydroorotase [Bacteroidetes bacterium]|nr:dihydroorotase [Bacteroidota bacterium]
MDLLIKSAKIVDSTSAWNGKKSDILIENGYIKKIGTDLKVEKSFPVFEAADLHVSIGWFDLQVNFNDPGLEHKEDLQSGCKAAAFGGFTGVACMPSNHTPTQSKSEVEYILTKTRNQAVDVFPIGALSKNMEGKEMTELFDMHSAGAIAFSDNKKPISDAGLLSRALLYAKGFEAKIIHYPEEAQLALGGKISEGKMSTHLGIKGIPALAEELMVARDIALCEYNSYSIHLSNISTAKSVEMVREAKEKGIKVSCGVAVHNLVADETALNDFDSNYKVKPPLRTLEDVEALWAGLLDNTIDVICSDHSPQDIESKEREFDHAAFGMIGLETCFGLIQLANQRMELHHLLDKISRAPRNIVALEVPAIEEGSAANLTLFAPNTSWKFSANNIQSKSKNTPFIGKELKGKVYGIINKNQFFKN